MIVFVVAHVSVELETGLGVGVFAEWDRAADAARDEVALWLPEYSPEQRDALIENQEQLTDEMAGDGWVWWVVLPDEAGEVSILRREVL